MTNPATLGALLARSGRLAPERAVSIITQIASALDGTDHADLNPANIIVAADDVAYLLSGHPTRSNSAADVYALTAVLFECLTGFPAFADTARAGAEVPRPSQLSPSVPATFDDVILRGMAPNPADRYRSAGELAEAARRALPSVAVQHPTPQAPPVIVAGQQYGQQYPSYPPYPNYPPPQPAAPEPAAAPPAAERSGGGGTAVPAALLAILGSLWFGFEAAAGWATASAHHFHLPGARLFITAGYAVGTMMLFLGAVLLLRRSLVGRWLIVTGYVVALMFPAAILLPQGSLFAAISLSFALSAILALLPSTKRWCTRP